MADEKPEGAKETRAGRLRRAGLFVLFSTVLLIPKTLALRRRRTVWNGLRVLAVLGGGLLIAAGTVSGIDSTRLLLGGLMILLALGIPPQKNSGSMDERARELGALVVLNGGLYRVGNEKPVPVRLFLAPERLHVLDERERPVLEIPVADVRAVRVTGEGQGTERTLVVEWQDGKAEFLYQGFFAEHLAEVVRRTVDSRLRSKLRVLR